MNRARQLTKKQTDAEKLLWQRLRNRQIGNHKFRRQHRIASYIVDFACLEQKLIIEIDGGQHSEQTHYDAFRTAYLESLGFRVFRFWNNDVLGQTDAVLRLIYDALFTPHPGLLPEGEGMSE